MRSRGAGRLVVLALIASLVSSTAQAAGRLPDGAVEGREHEVRLRSVLAELPTPKRKLSPTASAAAAAAITSCDPAAVLALGRKIEATSRAGDAPTACVVLEPPDSKSTSKQLLLLGPARVTGSEIAEVKMRVVAKKRRQVVAHLSERGKGLWQFGTATIGDAPLAITADGEVVDFVTVAPDPEIPEALALTLGGRKGFERSEAARLQAVFEQARREEVIELGRTAAMSRAGRQIFAATAPSIDEKAEFPDDCPTPENPDAFVLGCYHDGTNALFILRVERTDLAGIMPVTAAHEMLHAAYAKLSDRRKHAVDVMVAEYLAATPNPRIQETLAEYDAEDPAVHESEAHSLVGTEVRDLPRDLERHYSRYFDDRGAVVTMFEGYQQVFDNLEATQDRLVAELDALEARLSSLGPQVDAAGAEADRLFQQINSLRNQGRIDESNALVDAQNAAVNRANSLSGQYNSLVGQYNAKAEELNALAFVAVNLYKTISPADDGG